MNEAEPSRAGDHDVSVVVLAAEATPELWPRVLWALVALAVLEVVATAAAVEVSTVDVDAVASEEAEVSAAVEEASEAAAEISAVVVTEADMAHPVMLRPGPVLIAGTAVMAIVTEVTEEVTEGVIEAPVGMIREAVVAHMRTDTAAAIAMVADTAEIVTDVPEATTNPSADEKVGIANGTGTTTDLVMTTAAVSAASTVATKTLESCDATEQSSSRTHVVGCRSHLSVINTFLFITRGKHAALTTTTKSQPVRDFATHLCPTWIRQFLSLVSPST